MPSNEPSTLTKILVVGAAGVAAWLIFRPSALAAGQPAPYTPHMTGTDFLASIQGLTGSARENKILAAAAQTPDLLQAWVPIPVSIPGHSGHIFVTSDYYGIGTNEDWLRTPMLPATAQRIADYRGAMLPTRKIVKLIHQHATRIGFSAKQTARDASSTYGESNAAIRAKIGSRTGLFADHKKDIVVTPALVNHPGNVAIYGAWWDNGAYPIQDLNASSHSKGYVDYSHGLRLVRNTMDIDGRAVNVADILRDPALHSLISDEGIVPTAAQRYSV